MSLILPELIMQRREAWLNRLSSTQQQKEASTHKNGTQAKELPLSPPASPSPPPPSTPAENHQDRAPPAEGFDEKSMSEGFDEKSVSEGFDEKLTVLPKPSPTDDVADWTTADGRQLSDFSSLQTAEGSCDEISTRSTKSCDEIPTRSTESCDEIPTGSAKTAVQLPVKTDTKVEGVDETGDGKKNGPSPSSKTSLAQTASAKPRPAPEKTADQQKLQAFLEKVFNCTLTLTDEVPRMRFSGGKMRVPHHQFPTSLEDLEEKMKVLVRQAFDKQINKVCSFRKHYEFGLSFKVGNSLHIHTNTCTMIVSAFSAYILIHAQWLFLLMNQQN